MVHPLVESARVEAASCQVVSRRHAERQRQLCRSPRARRPPQQGGDHLGRRAGRSPDAHLFRSLSPGQPVRERAEVARREAGRSRGALPAARPRAGDCHARVRAHRRHPFGGLWRVQRRVAARSHQRLPVHAARDGRRRLASRPGRPAQTDGGRSAAGDAQHPQRRHRPAAARVAAADQCRRGTRPLVPPPDAGRALHLRTRAHGRGGHALHPLHVRHDREAEGHRAHDRRVPRRHLRDDQVGLRSQGRRRLLVHCGHRLGHRTQLRRLRAARERRDRADVRRRARLAGEGSFLADRRALRRDDLLYGADRDSRVHAVGNPVAGQARSVDRCACWDRSANPSIPKPGSGITGRSAASAVRSSTPGGRRKRAPS